MTTHLTDTQIRIALAKWEGWTPLWDIHPSDWSPDRKHWFPPGAGKSCDSQVLSPLPNYPASLDACHAIEVKLTDEEFARYETALTETVGHWTALDYRPTISASAEHRSLALFRALNLGELGD